MELFDPLVANSQFAPQAITYSDTAGVSNSWPAGPQGVLIWATTACYVVVGEDVTATILNATPIPANTPIPFVTPIGATTGTGAPWRVSVIQISDGGVAYATPCNRR